MLSFVDQKHSRRSFLQVGSLALGGLTLPGLLASQAATSENRRVLKGKSVIFLFLHGGPSQIETFDPKMSAPAEIRSTTGELKTTVPGFTIGGTFPKLASMADKFSVVRSFVTGDGNHDIKPIVGKDTFGANLGTIYSRVAGINHPSTCLPSNIVLFPRSVEPMAQGANLNFGKFHDTGVFGVSYAPFDPSAGGKLKDDMKMNLPMSRIEDRRQLLNELDRMKGMLQGDDTEEGIDRVREQAFTTIMNGVADAFDLKQESERTVAKYDTAPLVRPENINKKWNNYKNYVDNAKSLGRLMLLARRLCERGCGFVTVTTNFVWDMHADQNNAGPAEGMRYMGTPLDHAVAAFLEDVHARGMSEDILLVVCGEMGRTPKINKNGGRDHWGNIAPLLLAGGGLRMGQVVGQSTRDAGVPSTQPYTIKNLIATIMHTLFDMGELRVLPNLPREIAQTMTSWEAIPELV